LGSTYFKSYKKINGGGVRCMAKQKIPDQMAEKPHLCFALFDKKEIILGILLSIS
jgi:hypothetical protein